MALLGRLMAAIRGTDYVAGDVQDWLDECADLGDKRCSDYTLYEEFYNGDRGALLRDRARAYLHRYGVPFCENFTEPVVDTLAERLEVIGFASSIAATTTVDGKEETSDPVAALCEDWWQANRMDGQQGVVHTQALMKGDEFLIVEWDEAARAPMLRRQRQHQVKVCYSEDVPDRIDYAVKVWATNAKGPQNAEGKRVQRMNLYFPDHVEKWFRLHNGLAGKGGWSKWRDVGDTSWPVWWTTTSAEGGEPFGIALFHFRHKPLGNGHGRSRVRQAIPFQEQLNKYTADLNDLIDNHALPQDYVTGVAGDVTLTRVPGDIWKAQSENAEFGRLEASPTSNLLEAIEGLLSRLARRSRIPMHLLTGGTPPSGEALKTSESGLVSTAKDCQVEFGNTWEDALLLGVRLAATFGSDETKTELSAIDLEKLTIDAQWANPETRSDLSDLQAAALKKQLGVSKHTLLTELGYDPEKEAEHRSAEADEAAQALAGALGDPAFGGAGA